MSQVHLFTMSDLRDDDAEAVTARSEHEQRWDEYCLRVGRRIIADHAAGRDIGDHDVGAWRAVVQRHDQGHAMPLGSGLLEDTDVQEYMGEPLPQNTNFWDRYPHFQHRSLMCAGPAVQTPCPPSPCLPASHEGTGGTPGRAVCRNKDHSSPEPNESDSDLHVHADEPQVQPAVLPASEPRVQPDVLPADEPQVQPDALPAGQPQVQAS